MTTHRKVGSATAKARARITVWEEAGPITDAERRRALRRMTQEDAQRAFAHVLALWRPPECPRETSGLAELERLLADHARSKR